MLRVHIVTLTKPGKNPDCSANFHPLTKAEANYKPLIDKLVELKRLAKVELTWVGRLAAYKMQILPQILTYFGPLILL